MKDILLGYAPLDAVHTEFEALLQSANASEPSQLLAALKQVHEHLVDHFAQEDRWMQETGFPAQECHMEEHARVLASAAQVVEQVQSGQFDIGFHFVDALVDWFPGHADYLDSALAIWMCKRRFGARPVVVHPRMERSSVRHGT
jgi:hemerythrin